MRRFSEVLLLVSFTLLSSLFVNGGGLLPTVNNRARRNAVIRGLLFSRQVEPCDPGYDVCQVVGCCPDDGWSCCLDSNCCAPDTVCVLASNNIYGCCPDGEVCSGPVGGPTTIEETPPPTGTDTDTLAPVPTPTTVNTLVPTTVVNSQPLPTTPTFNSVPGGTQELPTEAPTDNTVPVQPTQTTINVLSSILSNHPAVTSALGSISAAEQAQLYRPLLALVGILLAALY